MSPDAPQPGVTGPHPLVRLVERLELTPFERDLVLLCAAVELDTEVRPLLERAASGRGLPTFGLALEVLPGAHWSAVAPDRPLRRWELLEIGSGETLLSSPLLLSERVLHHLAGHDLLDERLLELVAPVEAPQSVPAAHAPAVARLEAAWRADDAAPPVLLQGAGRGMGAEVAGAAAAAVGGRLYRLRAADIPAAPAERHRLVRLWRREAALADVALLVTGPAPTEPHRIDALVAFVASLETRVVVAIEEALPLTNAVHIEVPRLTVSEREGLWRRSLEPGSDPPGLDVQAVARTFAFDAATIRQLAGTWGADRRTGHRGDGRLLIEACREQARPRLDALAQRIEARASWEQLVLPDASLAVLRQITANVRQRARVHDDWGFGRLEARGLGVAALFTGPSGTGKTLAAEVLARALELDLYRIDLSAVVSKYIGETEKNLRRVFDAAEEGGTILLFDEADALFGKRSEVRDSHDRYANLEVGYLLQRMEAYSGLAILTTNMKQALDPAFLRRLRFVVRFPFPDEAQRAALWKKAFPTETPLDGIDPAALASLELSGGQIRNVALLAAFLAADRGTAVCMAHVVEALRSEYAKLERPFPEAAVRRWS